MNLPEIVILAVLASLLLVVAFRPARRRSAGLRLVPDEPHRFFKISGEDSLELEPLELLASKVPAFDPDRFRERRLQDLLRESARPGRDIAVLETRVIEAWIDGASIFATVAFDTEIDGRRSEQLRTFSLSLADPRSTDWSMIEPGPGAGTASL